MKSSTYAIPRMPSITTTPHAFCGVHECNGNPSTWTSSPSEKNMDIHEFYYPDSEVPADQLFAIGEATVLVRDWITECMNDATIENHGGVYTAETRVNGQPIGVTGTSYYDAAYNLAMALTKHFGLPF